MLKRSIFLVILMVIITISSIPAFALDTTTVNTITVSSNSEGIVVFKVNLKNKGIDNYWINFRDYNGSGVQVLNGEGTVQHTYLNSGTYEVVIGTLGIKPCKRICSVKVTVTAAKGNLYLKSLDKNQLKIGVKNNSVTNHIDWSNLADDLSSVDLASGITESSHDYAYNPGKTKTIIITSTVGTTITTATLIINDSKGGKSTFVVNPPKDNSDSKITSWAQTIPCGNITNPTPPPVVTVITVTKLTNEWKVGNIVALPIDTAIRSGTGLNFITVETVKGSYWLAEISEGPISENYHTWWRVTLANGSTGWIRQDLVILPADLF